MSDSSVSQPPEQGCPDSSNVVQLFQQPASPVLPLPIQFPWRPEAIDLTLDMSRFRFATEVSFQSLLEYLVQLRTDAFMYQNRDFRMELDPPAGSRNSDLLAAVQHIGNISHGACQ